MKRAASYDAAQSFKHPAKTKGKTQPNAKTKANKTKTSGVHPVAAAAAAEKAERAALVDRPKHVSVASSFAYILFFLSWAISHLFSSIDILYSHFLSMQTDYV